MIDTTRLKIRLAHRPFGPRVIEPDCPSGLPKEYRRRKKVTFEHPPQGIHVTSLENGEALELENSFLTALQGHNVCGSNDLRWIAEVTCAKAFNRLGMQVSSRTLSRALDEAELRELHVAVGFRCQDDEEKAALIEAIAHIVRSLRHTTVTTYGSESTYISRSGAKVVFYDKARQIMAKKWAAWKRHKFMGRLAVRRYAKKLVRMELRMQAPWLEAHGLVRLDQWTSKSVRAVISSELKSLDLNVPVSSLDPYCCEGLPKSLKRFVMAAHSGVPIREGYSERSERDLRRRLLDEGFLLDPEAGDAMRVTDVSRLLSPERMLVTYSSWIRRRGLIAVAD